MVVNGSILLCLLSLLSLGSWASASEEHVLSWTDENFIHELGRHDNTLVMFYAPWCGHCKKLKPEYAKAAEMLRGHDPEITLAKVDCTEAGKETCNKYSVSGYPTLKIFAEDKFIKEYSGPRDANGIVKYMKSQVGPASKEIKTVDELKTFLDSPTVSVIGFFDKEDSPLATAFQSVAKQLREKARFGYTLSNEVSDKENYKEQELRRPRSPGYSARGEVEGREPGDLSLLNLFPWCVYYFSSSSDQEVWLKFTQLIRNTIVIYRPAILQNKFEESKLAYSGKESDPEIKKFIEKNYHGLVGVRTSDNVDDFKKPLVIAYYGVDYEKNPKGTNYWRNRIMKVAKDYASEFTFAISSKDHFQHELNEFGIDYVKSDKPVILARDEQNQKFVLEEEFSIDSFTNFMNDLQAGALQPYLKSEPIPEDNSGPVKVAVAKNFDEVVINNGKDTLIEFYAPWCGHCKKLAPVFDELGEKLAGEDVDIVKIDATANDVPQPFDVRGFPTLYWAPKDSKNSPVRYEGGRELDDFIKYIAEHATNPLKGWDRNGKATKATQDEL